MPPGAYRRAGVRGRSLGSDGGRLDLPCCRAPHRPRGSGVRHEAAGCGGHPPAQPRHPAARPPAARLRERLRAQPLPAGVRAARALRQDAARQADVRPARQVRGVLGARGGRHPGGGLAAVPLPHAVLPRLLRARRQRLVEGKRRDARLAARRACRQGAASGIQDRAGRRAAPGILVGVGRRQARPRGHVPPRRGGLGRAHELRAHLRPCPSRCCRPRCSPARSPKRRPSTSS